MSAPAPAEPPGAPVPFEEVLVAALDVLEREGQAGIERLLAAHPAHATRLRGHLSRLHGLGLLGGTTGASGATADPTPAFPERLGDFRLLQRLGGGGMGVVYLARQESLGRTVALKLVRSEHLYFPGARERFRREVDAIAKLQHPGIVPVHAAGEDAGVPWLAMEHVVGASLDRLIEGVAGRDPATLRGSDLRAAVVAALGAGAPVGASASDAAAQLFTGTWSSACLRIARAVALALQHAHERGVLHRDVKPSNIMLTPDGRVLLLDFGLAVATGDARLTGSGSQLGTPAYMSPEQMRGDPRAIDARSDVYSLAVTLYELLTLRMPFTAESTAAIRELVLAGRLPPLREHNRAVSRDVEVVVRKACDLDRDRRYGDIAAFAADLGNLLEMRPVSAQPPSAWLVARRWAQRHPARAMAAVAGSLLFLVAPSVFLLQQQAANREIRAALTEARDQGRQATLARDAARQQRDLAREAVDTMLRRVADEKLFDIPRLQRVRRDLLASAKSFYERFLADQQDDRDLLEQTARATLRMVFVDGDLGQVGTAAETAGRAVELARRVLADRAQDSSAQLLLADALMTRGRAEHLQQRAEAALASFAEARGLVEAVRQREPQNVRAIVHLLGIERGASLALRSLGRHEEALDVVAALDELWDRHGAATAVDEYREVAFDHVIASGNDEARFLLTTGRLDEARVAADRLSAIAASVNGEDLPDSSRIALAMFAVTRAQLAAAAGNPAALEPGLHECLGLVDAILADNPDQVGALRTRAHVTNQLGLLLLADPARAAEGMPWLEKSLQTLRALVATDPTVLDNRANLAATLCNIGSQYLDAAQPARAKQLFGEAEELARACWEQAPQRLEWRTYLYNAVWFTGQSCGLLDQPEAQVEAAARLLAILPDDGRTLRIAAGLIGHAIKDLAADPQLAPAGRAQRTDELARLAMSHLEQAADRGCVDVAHLRDGADFSPLRGLPGFAAVLDRVAANARAAGAAGGK